MKAILIDDEILAIQSLNHLLEKIEDIEVVGTYTNPKEAVQALETMQVDVIFLDIEMGASHGIDVANDLRKKYAQTNIVFVTAHAEFAIDAFDLRAVDYLLKPIRFERLKETIIRLKEQMEVAATKEEDERPQLFVQVMKNFKLYKSPTEEIKWRTRKVKELFAYLWHHYPNPVPRAHIMEDLWREQHIESAVQLMHTSFYHLRKTIREHGYTNPVEFSNEQYTLNIDVKSDLCEMKNLMVLKQPTDEQIERMISIYKGNYFEEDNYEWAFPKQEQLKRKFLAILEKFVEEKMAKNDLSFIVATSLEKMVALDPYNERFVYLLIDYYGKTRNIQKVVKIAGQFEDLFTKELGIEVPEEISNIYYEYVTQKNN